MIPESCDSQLQEQDNSQDMGNDALIQIAIILPSIPDKLCLMVSPHEQVHELRQSIQEMPAALEHSCFHLEHIGKRINDFIQISEIPSLSQGSEIKLVLDPYTEKEARLHFIRIRELIGAAGDRTDTVHGVLAGTPILDTSIDSEKSMKEERHVAKNLEVEEYDFSAQPSIASVLPKVPEPSPKTVKAISLSSWNPPPSHLRQRGHLLYLIVTTNEGEQYQITSHIGGFYVNRSSNTKFDPSPRQAPRNASSHSLLNLLDQISPSFAPAFHRLQDAMSKRDPLATFQITNAIPAAPWLVPPMSSSLTNHQSDMARSQESYLISGIDSIDTLRDWNEEFQSARELPRDTVQDRVFRERLISKLFADFTDAASKGAVLVARNEVPPLNPTEAPDAQIFVYNNVFFSFGADGVGTFTSEGGDEAARVATGKDVMGVRLVNQLDVEGIFTPATVVVDYLGRRIVGQSIVPGIFKQREPGENQIDYGAVDGRDIIAADEKFVPGFAKLSAAFKVKKHPVWDKNGRRFDLEGSVETKGLFGTDGRKYILDLYRITPLDIAWVEGGAIYEEPLRPGDITETESYPHRMTVLRPELVESFARHKMREFIAAEHKRLKDIDAKEKDGSKKRTENTTLESVSKVDLSNFMFSLNPDVFCGQTPQTEAEKEEMLADEHEVRKACTYLLETVIPELLRELQESELSFPMDGRSLSKMLHKRGINIRYLGNIASRCHKPRLQAMADVCIQEMVARSFKHITSKYLKSLPLPLSSACISHLLNCLLGEKLNSQPAAAIDKNILSLYPSVRTDFTFVTPASLQKEIEQETNKRFRFRLSPHWNDSLKKLQLVREVSLKLGLQLEARKFQFEKNCASADAKISVTSENGILTATTSVEKRSSGESRKKRKKGRESSPTKSTSTTVALNTFSPEDIVNIVPIVKDSAPRSTLAEEAFEAGRISLAQQQRKLGQDLLLESLSLHEQIYGILHPEVARIYHQLSLLYFQLEEKDAAIELARKAIIVSERTIGIDSEETLLNYLNLSLFLHQIGDSMGALGHAKHALNLWKVMFGYGHPDSVTTLNNAAVMLQNLKAYHESRRWFEESLQICENIFGPKSVNSATLLFQLAQALALDGDANGSVAKMRDSYAIFRDELGLNDKNTKEAESWLDQLTQNAVAIKKNAKELEARRLRTGIRFPPRTIPDSNSAAIGGTTAGLSAQGKLPIVDQRNIDDLLKFIEGTDQKQGSKKKPSRRNPKQRGKASS